MKRAGCLWIAAVSLLAAASAGVAAERIQLPDPLEKGGLSLEEALWLRKSVRNFEDRAPGWEHVGQLLWAAQGVNRREVSRRTAPSAWGAYPLELYVILPDGVYRYIPGSHEAELVTAGDVRGRLTGPGLSRENLHGAPCVFLFCADIGRLTPHCETLGDTLRYIHQESGHAAQNVLLQLAALGMGGVPIGANVTLQDQQTLGVPAEEKPVYILATGYPAGEE